jgi:hypothetical protein
MLILKVMGFEVLMAVTMMKTIFWDAMPSSESASNPNKQPAGSKQQIEALLVWHSS